MKNKQLNDEEKRALVKLKELAKRIQYHNKLYHEKDKPKIPDNKFDEYIKENESNFKSEDLKFSAKLKK